MKNDTFKGKILPFFNNITLTTSSFITASVIFSLAFIPRALDLGTGLTFDEVFWLPNATSFVTKITHFDFITTFLASHPGVTTMFLSGIFMKLFVHQGMTFPQILTIARFPIVLVTSLGILIMYFLLRKIFNGKIAFLGAALIALDPFYIAHSRLVHVDALLTTFMVLSFLSLLVYLIRPEKSLFLFFSGIFLGLSLLTKLPALGLIPIFVLTLMIWQIAIAYSKTRSYRKTFSSLLNIEFFDRVVKPSLIILFIGIILFILLWPAMWINPLFQLVDLLKGLIYFAKTTHYSGFFMGTAGNTMYGPSFYPVVALMKATPLTLIFSLAGIVYLFHDIRNKKFSKENLIIISLLLYILIFTLMMTIGDKKMDRYLLPVFPLIDIVAAIGLYCSYKVITKHIILKQNPMKYSNKNKDTIFKIFLVFIVICQVVLLLPIAPYYLSYSNPIVYGGPKNAQNVIVMGFGEGYDLAAEYLNNKPNAENLTVMTEFSGFSEYFKGKAVNMDALSSDYIVFYIANVQMRTHDALWNEYKDKKPEKIITLNSIEYCWIYQTDIERNSL